MPTKETKNKWLRESKKSIEHLISSSEHTVLDAYIFSPKNLGCIYGCLPVKTEPNECEHFNRLRANRLKFLGYSWIKDRGVWIHESGANNDEWYLTQRELKKAYCNGRINVIALSGHYVTFFDRKNPDRKGYLVTRDSKIRKFESETKGWAFIDRMKGLSI